MTTKALDDERLWATRLATRFVVWSFFWIILSDILVAKLVQSHLSFWVVEMQKGLAYVLISASLLWLALKAREREHRDIRAANEQRLQSLKDADLIGIAGIGADGRFIYANWMLLEMLGYSKEELFGVQPRNLVAPDSKHEQIAADREFEQHGRTSLFRVTLNRKDGSRLPVLGGRARVSSTGESIAYFLDVSPLAKSEEEKSKLQERILQSDKASALAQFASGVAHNFNNELSIVVGYGTVLQERLSQEAALRHYVEQILSAADRVTKLIQQLLAFSRKQPIHPEILDVNAFINELRPTLSRLLKENIRFEVTTESEPQNIRIDRAQLMQVILTLVANAQDAMPNGGVLAIQVEQGTCKSDAAGSHTDVVHVKVNDNGIGMDDATRQRIFDPFFTTKRQFGGTGLGLSSAYGIVRENGGDIEVSSKPGEGTRFLLIFPRMAGTLVVLPQSGQSATSPTISGNILLVEDRDDLREMLAEILIANGHKVVQARDGVEAIAAAQSSPVDLIVTDVVMPRLNGLEAVKIIRKIRSDVRVIYVSGSADMLDPNDQDIVLWKPVQPKNLLKAIRSCLSPSTKLLLTA